MLTEIGIYFKKNMVTESIFQDSVINEAVTIISDAAKCKGVVTKHPQKSSAWHDGYAFVDVAVATKLTLSQL